MGLLRQDLHAQLELFKHAFLAAGQNNDRELVNMLNLKRHALDALSGELIQIAHAPSNPERDGRLEGWAGKWAVFKGQLPWNMPTENPAGIDKSKVQELLLALCENDAWTRKLENARRRAEGGGGGQQLQDDFARQLEEARQIGTELRRQLDAHIAQLLANPETWRTDLAPICGAVDALCAITSADTPEDARAAFEAYERQHDRFVTRIERDATASKTCRFECISLLSMVKTKARYVLEAQLKAFEAAAELERIQEEFPSSARTPVRMHGSIEQSFKRIESFDPAWHAKIELDEHRDTEKRERANNTRVEAAIARKQAHALSRKFQEALVRHIDVRDFQRQLGKLTTVAELDHFVTSASEMFCTSGLLLLDPASCVQLFRQIAKAYRGVQAGMPRGDGSVTPGGAGPLPGRGRAGRRAGARTVGGRGRGRNSGPRGRGVEAAGKEMAGNVSTEKVSNAVENSSVETPTREASRAELEAPGWITPGIPTWSGWRDGETETVRYLREVPGANAKDGKNLALEACARVLWKWNQQSMSGRACVLDGQEAVALARWAVARSAVVGPDEPYLFAKPFTIVCAPGKGDFADQWQLKFVNRDPEVPKVKTSTLDANGKRIEKSATFHFVIDEAAVGAVMDALAQLHLPDAD